MRPARSAPANSGIVASVEVSRENRNYEEVIAIEAVGRNGCAHVAAIHEAIAAAGRLPLGASAAPHRVSAEGVGSQEGRAVATAQNPQSKTTPARATRSAESPQRLPLTCA